MLSEGRIRCVIGQRLFSKCWTKTLRLNAIVRLDDDQLIDKKNKNNNNKNTLLLYDVWLREGGLEIKR